MLLDTHLSLRMNNDQSGLTVDGQQRFFTDGLSSMVMQLGYNTMDVISPDVLWEVSLATSNILLLNLTTYKFLCHGPCALNRGRKDEET